VLHISPNTPQFDDMKTNHKPPGSKLELLLKVTDAMTKIRAAAAEPQLRLSTDRMGPSQPEQPRLAATEHHTAFAS
jgi:hypothetical protein